MLLPQTHRGKFQDRWLQQRTCRFPAARQHVDKIFLVGLTESQSIDHAMFSKLREPQHVPPKGTLENMPVNLGAVEHPSRTKATLIDKALCVPFHAMPRRALIHAGIAKHFVAQLFRQLPSERQACIALDAAFTLLEVERVGGKVPMNHMRIPGMEV